MKNPLRYIRLKQNIHAEGKAKTLAAYIEVGVIKVLNIRQTLESFKLKHNFTFVSIFA